MQDHVHLVWRFQEASDLKSVQTSFKKHTALKTINLIKSVEPEYLNNFISERNDRIHKFWKLNSSHKRILNQNVLIQKIDYIHLNPTKGKYKTVETPTDYLYSSAKSYKKQISQFSFLTVINLLTLLK